jgi:hypothetical protein
MPYRSTREVAILLGLRPSNITRALWEGRITPPMKGPSGAYLWIEADIQRASWVLRHRDADDVLGGANHE